MCVYFGLFHMFRYEKVQPDGLWFKRMPFENIVTCMLCNKYELY